jgi:endogenous inhibitor of DNA gyrase (YacG/DUF329 family)
MTTLDATLTAIAEATTPTCAVCPAPLTDSPSVDFCSPRCQAVWHQARADAQAVKDLNRPDRYWVYPEHVDCSCCPDERQALTLRLRGAPSIEAAGRGFTAHTVVFDEVDWSGPAVQFDRLNQLLHLDPSLIFEPADGRTAGAGNSTAQTGTDDELPVRWFTAGMERTREQFVADLQAQFAAEVGRRRLAEQLRRYGWQQ